MDQAAHLSGARGLEAAVTALADGTRRRILQAFLDDGRPRTTDEVAAEAGVHRTVARGHLERLAGLGLLSVEKRRGRPGKPANLYRPAVGRLSLQLPARRFDLLAEALAVAVESLEDEGLARARSGGRAVGRRLVDGRAHTLAEVVAALDRLGGDWELEGDTVVSHACLFREACGGARAACHAQAGVLEGMLEVSAEPLTVRPLGVTADGRGCRYRIAASPAQHAPAR